MEGIGETGLKETKTVSFTRGSNGVQSCSILRADRSSQAQQARELSHEVCASLSHREEYITIILRGTLVPQPDFLLYALHDISDGHIGQANELRTLLNVAAGVMLESR